MKLVLETLSDMTQTQLLGYTGSPGMISKLSEWAQNEDISVDEPDSKTIWVLVNDNATKTKVLRFIAMNCNTLKTLNDVNESTTIRPLHFNGINVQPIVIADNAGALLQFMCVSNFDIDRLNEIGGYDMLAKLLQSHFDAKLGKGNLSLNKSWHGAGIAFFITDEVIDSRIITFIR